MARFSNSALFPSEKEAILYFGHEWDQSVSVGHTVLDDRTPVHVPSDSDGVLNDKFAT